MSSEIRDLLTRLARDPVTPLDVGSVRRRATVLRASAAVTTLAVIITFVATGAGVWRAVAGDGDPLPPTEGRFNCDTGPFELVAVYLRPDPTERGIRLLLDHLSDDPRVRILYVSPEEALTEMRIGYATERGFWRHLPKGALPARIDVYVEEDDPDLMRGLADLASTHPVVEAVYAVSQRYERCELARVRDRSRRVHPTTRRVTIASGVKVGEPWVFEGYRAADAGSRGLGEHLCVGFDWGDEPDITCMIGGAKPMRGFDYGLRMGVPTSGPRAVFIGAISERVERVELRMDRRVLLLADIYEPPKELDLDFRFFIGFAPLDVDVAVVAVGASGRDLGHESWDALSVLRVGRSGSGEGEVVGYRTEQIEICELDEDCREPRPIWIDCGSECIARLDGARITLRATPSEGSVFVGWRGACSGTGACELVVDRNLEVEALFEDD